MRRFPRRHSALTCALSSVLVISALGCGDDDEPTVDEARTVGDFVRADPRLESLEEAFRNTDQLSDLDQPGELTLFAPVDDAFVGLAADLDVSVSELLALAAVGDLLKYHVHDATLSLADLETVTAITTRQGSEIHVRLGLDGLLLNDGVLVTTETIEAENGVIHVVDAVLRRPLITATQTFESEPGIPLAEPSAEDPFGTNLDTLTVTEAGFVHAMQIEIDISHPRVSDLFIFLFNSSTGRSISLVRRPSSAGADLKTTFADSAALDSVTDLEPEGSAFPAASYRANDSLELLVGTLAAGDWQLLVYDSRTGEAGTLNRWSLKMTVGEAVPEPALVFGRATTIPNVLARGFKEPAAFSVRQVGGEAPGEIEIGGTVGAASAAPSVINEGVGSVDFEIARDAALGPLAGELYASSGAISRVRRGATEIVDPDRSGIAMLSQLSLSDLGAAGFRGNDVWGWTDPMTGVEYAIMGTSVGTTFVDLSTPENPVVVGMLPTQTTSSDWRDMKVYADHAFIVSEASDHGLQVFDLTQLRGASGPQTLTPSATFAAFGNAHNIAINEDTGFAYVVGATEGDVGLCFGGLLMLDISDPLAPSSAGCFGGGVPVGETPGPDFPLDAYIHDVQCVTYAGPDVAYQGREICISSDGADENNGNFLAIADVTNKATPIQVSRKGYEGAGYAHQGWLTEDHQYFILNDEFDEFVLGSNTQTYVWDVRDLDNPVVIGSIVNPRDAVGHNTYIKGNLAYQANYTSGLRIVDVTDLSPGTADEIGYFDTFPNDDADDDGVTARCNAGLGARGVLPHPDQTLESGCGIQSFQGAWSSYPFFDSGLVILSDIERGLFVLRPDASLIR